MSGGRLVVTAVVAVAAVVLVVALVAGGPEDEPVKEIVPTDPNVDPGLFKNAKGCGTCHDEIYREWRKNFHAKAMTDPYFDSQSRKTPSGEQNPACIPCHLPLPLHGHPLGERPLVRMDRREDGIDCLSCHLLPRKGGVAATHPDSKGPCNPIFTPEMASMDLCKGCHNQHWTHDEWEASPYATGEGGFTRRNCLDCHMPMVEGTVVKGGEPRKRRHHRNVGGHDLDRQKEAVTFTITRERGEVVVATTNSGAGHKIPTDSRHRSYNVLVWFHDEAGNLIEGPMELAEYRLYYRQDLREVESTQIKPLATASARRAIPQRLEKGRAVARLYYCLTPIIAAELRKDWKRAPASLIAEATLDLD